MMDSGYEIVSSEAGVRQCRPMPSTEELDEFYEKRYFETNDLYVSDYNDREIRYFRDAVRRKLELVRSTFDGSIDGATVLEVGVGEGWTLDVLVDEGLDATGVDYSDVACGRHNPHVVRRLRCGKPDAVLAELTEEGLRFDIIWLDNVLEHSPDPGGLLDRLHELAGPRGRLVVEVPNDYSTLQMHLLETRAISQPFWEAVPEHLSYFSVESLQRFASVHGWEPCRLMSDFPIDLFLLNERSNYVEQPDAGKAAHWARIGFEEAFAKVPTSTMIRFLESAADIGLGRNLVGVFAADERTAQRGS